MLNKNCHTRQNCSKNQFGNRRNPRAKSRYPYMNTPTPGITHADNAVKDYG